MIEGARSEHGLITKCLRFHGHIPFFITFFPLYIYIYLALTNIIYRSVRVEMNHFVQNWPGLNLFVFRAAYAGQLNN